MVSYPFFTAKRQGGGRGLVLTIARPITESYRGRIHVEGHEGHGTTVLMNLPVATTER
jgi:signal transduction histidine kinase